MKLLFSLLFVASCFFSDAQGNLQFNQVKLVTALESVPIGKVWKVTSILPSLSYSFTFNSAPAFYIIQVNGNPRTYGHPAWQDDASNSTSPITFINTPIWLPEGTTLSAGANVGEISIIEFNIIP